MRTNPEKISDLDPNANCWDCQFNNFFPQDTFLGICTWFEKHGKGRNKEIPPEIVDKGCKHFQSKK